MSIRDNSFSLLNLIVPKNILMSVFDKEGLDILIAGILAVNPLARFFSTGGTGKKIIEILLQIEKDNSRICPEMNYCSVEDFTGAPEMEGGLVKTLHPKIHAGLLAERNNPAHEEYLYRVLAAGSKYDGVYLDIFVGNLYPFASVIAKEDCTPEMARVNIDIGGPAMTMASAKNWHSIATVTNPALYKPFVDNLKNNGGTTLEDRFYLAATAMKLIGEYRLAIGNYFNTLDFDHDVLPTLNIAK